MKLKAFRSLWGGLSHYQADGIYSFESLIKMTKQSKYNGIECPLTWALDIGKKRFLSELKEKNLEYIGMCFTDGPVTPGNAGYTNFSTINKCYSPVSKHIDVFKEQIEELLTLNPIKINCHAGNDYWTFNQADDFFKNALKWIEQFETEIMFEGHRKRFLYSPWIARDFIPSYGAEFKFVADHSHYINVAETNAQDQVLTDVIKMLSHKTSHIHCRVGFDHGPQVNDPQAPEWDSYVKGHEHWWDLIWNSQLERGFDLTTITTEHGPPNYQPALPYTKQPLADWWTVNSYIGDRQIQRFKSENWKKNSYSP